MLSLILLSSISLTNGSCTSPYNFETVISGYPGAIHTVSSIVFDYELATQNLAIGGQMTLASDKLERAYLYMVDESLCKITWYF